MHIRLGIILYLLLTYTSCIAHKYRICWSFIDRPKQVQCGQSVFVNKLEAARVARQLNREFPVAKHWPSKTK